ncbi:gp53-like domain-containing protein [Enterobacter roggenkampii]|uniref:gp53-like domain-containing protein n=1 Tax=Enterobacter roggenkampii TaxID=1812935 RepID=UPI00217D626D|nr:phage tail protein [Enterobacter roggenkampii]UWI96145.1 phage tail protein [Enterobacter roggenkampii]
MAKNNFKPFATGAGANVMSQADWEALPALLSGFTAGKASSAQVNKAIRQASFIAAALAQYTANKSGLDVLDDGDVSGFIAKMTTALGKDFQGLDATLTALAGLATGANKLPYFTGTDTAAQTDLTSVGRDIIGKSTIADILTYLGLGDVAKAGVAGGLLASDGYITLPLIIGGVKTNVILQWVTGPTAGAETVNYPNVTFPVTFPNACLFAAPFTVGNNTTSADQIFQAVSWTTSTAKVFPQWFGSGSQGLVHPIILAIGW